mmetsp:Transcript_75484/g.233034  ORF Transcript_75484/g.233034 Transcript_75484/m.233034 type:complete len:231 (-) Transcript_75484:51-743(-)
MAARMFVLAAALLLGGSGSVESLDSMIDSSDLLEDLYAEEELQDPEVDQVSLLQVRHTMQKGKKSSGPFGKAGDGEWDMSPSMVGMCDPSYRNAPDGTNALDNSCKQCVDTMDVEAYNKYVSLVADVPGRMVHSCQDGLFDGCRDCGAVAWVHDDWLPRRMECCKAEGAAQTCNQTAQERITFFQGQLKVLGCLPPPPAPAAPLAVPPAPAAPLAAPRRARRAGRARDGR